jgi:hypothetical protein
MGAVAAIASVVGTVAATGLSAASAAGAFKGSAPKSAVGGTDQAQMARQMLPGTKSDLAARGGAGLSPDYYANLLNTQTGGTGGLDILDQIRRETQA